MSPTDEKRKKTSVHESYIWNGGLGHSAFFFFWFAGHCTCPDWSIHSSSSETLNTVVPINWCLTTHFLQELSQGIGEALCALIDGKIDADGKLKRYLYCLFI